MNTNGYIRIKTAEQLKPRDVVIGRVGHRMFETPKTVSETPSRPKFVAEQAVVKLVDAPLWFVSQSSRLAVITEW